MQDVQRKKTKEIVVGREHNAGRRRQLVVINCLMALMPIQSG
jgi:hypothetical protein